MGRAARIYAAAGVRLCKTVAGKRLVAGDRSLDHNVGTI